MKDVTTYVGIDAHKKDLFVAMLIGPAKTPNFIEVPLVPWDRAWTRLDDAPLLHQLQHLLFAVPPVAGDAHQFVLWMPARSCTWSNQAGKLVATTVRVFQTVM
jgi:hypothetical protein